jgi:hypothetical protein
MYLKRLQICLSMCIASATLSICAVAAFVWRQLERDPLSLPVQVCIGSSLDLGMRKLQGSSTLDWP